MLNKTPQELRRSQRHLALLVAVCVVPPPKRHVFAIEAEELVIADGDAMRIATEVAKHLERAAERGFGVNHPVLPKESAQEKVDAAVSAD